MSFGGGWIAGRLWTALLWTVREESTAADCAALVSSGPTLLPAVDTTHFHLPDSAP